jgi:hypothetical protein
MIKMEKHKKAFEAARPAVLLRDGNCCAKWGSVLSLEIHHIEGYKRNEPELLITLCYLCHGVGPMGKESFDQWMLLGESGVEVLGRLLARKGLPRLKREQIFAFCSALLELGIDLNRSRMRAARERMKAIEGRCEGTKPYGHYPGEAAVLATMRDMRQTSTLAQIVTHLNSAGIPARKGGKWYVGTGGNILKG